MFSLAWRMNALAITDRIEGYASDGKNRCLHMKKQGTVTLDETQVTAWTYEFADPGRIGDQPRLATKEVGGALVYSWPST